MAAQRPSRARLEATIWQLVVSSIQISLGFLFSNILSFIFTQPNLPNSQKVHLELQGKTTLVTGSNVGIGYEIAKEHFIRGSHVILACRNEIRAKDAKFKMIKETGLFQDENRLEIILLDCSSLKKVREFAQNWNKRSSNEKQIDYLFLNAGIADKPQKVDRFTDEGFELVYVTNHLGPFLLTALLSLNFSSSARIIQTSSAAAYFGGFSENVKKKGKAAHLENGFHLPNWAPSILPQPGYYSQSKAMQVLFANMLQTKFDQEKSLTKQKNGGDGKISTSFHPGCVATNIFNALQFQGKWTKFVATIFPAIALNAKQGAQTALWLSISSKDFQPGGFYDRSNIVYLPWYRSMTPEKANRLWDRWNADADIKQTDWHF